eukprot:scaffold11763_cov71-Phaeocystis_antarctica.AAC.3
MHTVHTPSGMQRRVSKLGRARAGASRQLTNHATNTRDHTAVNSTRPRPVRPAALPPRAPPRQLRQRRASVAPLATPAWSAQHGRG